RGDALARVEDGACHARLASVQRASEAREFRERRSQAKSRPVSDIPPRSPAGVELRGREGWLGEQTAEAVTAGVTTRGLPRRRTLRLACGLWRPRSLTGRSKGDQ